MSFSNLKNNRKAAIDKLISQVESSGNNKSGYGDDRYWKPTRDKADNGYAVIRFLPASEGEDLPWVKYWDHGFKGPGGQWYIENSLTSIGQDDPVTELNSQLWNSGNEADKETARRQKRRLHHVSNILVISDPANPENEGKVFLYKYGKKIFDKLMEPVNPFDFWEGADFKLKIRKLDGWISYDKSEFSDASPLFAGDDEQLETLYNKLHSLGDLVDPKNYKSYDELKAKMNKILGISAGHEPQAPADLPDPAPAPEPASQPANAQQASSDDDDTLSYFANLAAQSDD
jgi:hypothetical protein